MVARLRTHCSTCGTQWATPRTRAYCDAICEERRPVRDRSAHLAEEQLRLERECEVLPPHLREQIEVQLVDVGRRRRASAAS